MAPKGKPSKNVEAKPSKKSSEKVKGKPSGKPSGKLSGKLGPVATPQPQPVVLPIGVKCYWIAIVLFMVVSLAGVIVMLQKYMKLKQMKTPYDAPFQVLRTDLATILERPDLEHGDPPAIATEVENLPNVIQAEHDNFGEKKTKYQTLLLKAMRSSSGPWKLRGMKLYYFSEEAKTWYDAENFCLSRDAHLASILNAEEQNFIRSELQNYSWIGLRIKNEDGVWGWSDGSKLVTRYWVSGKPRNGTVSGESGQNCAVMAPSSTANNWNEESCHKLYSWICKENLDNVQP